VNVLIIKNLWSLIFGNEKGKGFWAWITELNKHGIANIKDKGKIHTISLISFQLNIKIYMKMIIYDCYI